MVRFDGIERFPYPRSAVAGKLSDAAFLASCAPDAAILRADAATAVWRAPSRFRFIATGIETTLTIVESRPGSSVEFALANRVPGATLDVRCRLEFHDDGPDGTRVAWSAEVVARTGLLKIVPVGVLRAQIESELADLWRGVRAKLSS